MVDQYSYSLQEHGSITRWSCPEASCVFPG